MSPVEPPRVGGLQAAGVGVERLDRAAQHDVEERVHVELGRERVAHPADGGLQPAALAHRHLEAVLRVLDALAPVAGHQQEQSGQRQDEQDGEKVALRDLRGEEADRRQARVDDPDEPEHVELERGRDPARRELAQHRRAGVKQAAGGERRRQQRKVAQIELAARPPAAGRRPARPRATRRESRRAGGSSGPRRRIQSDKRPSSSPAATSSGTDAGGMSTSIGISTSCVGSTLPAPTGNSTPARIA